MNFIYIRISYIYEFYIYMDFIHIYDFYIYGTSGFHYIYIYARTYHIYMGYWGRLPQPFCFRLLSVVSVRINTVSRSQWTSHLFYECHHTHPEAVKIWVSNSIISLVLQCGGNDAEHEPCHKVTREYDALIGEIQQRCPRASIMLSKIPPRKNNKGMLDNISRVNVYLQHRASEGDDVSIMDVCPQDPALYGTDLVHFNTKGCRVYAKLMHSELSHFTRCLNHVFR